MVKKKRRILQSKGAKAPPFHQNDHRQLSENVVEYSHNQQLDLLERAEPWHQKCNASEIRKYFSCHHAIVKYPKLKIESPIWKSTSTFRTCLHCSMMQGMISSF